MKNLFLLTILFLLLSPLVAQDESDTGDAPYIYYYSNVLKGIVIERADGTDSRILGYGLVDEDVLWTRGPGWSPDGTWYAWHVKSPGGYYPKIGKGYVINVDGQRTVELLEHFTCVYRMLWHPTENILLVEGMILPIDVTHCPAYEPYPVTTYWLIDAETGIKLATFSQEMAYVDKQGLGNIFWLEQENAIKFGVIVYDGSEQIYQSFAITMYFNGTVHVKPYSRDEGEHPLAGLTPDDSLHQDYIYSDFTNWYEYPEERVDNIPPANDYNGWSVAGLWHDSGDWLLVGHAYCRAACAGVTGTVSVYYPKTGANREISDCGNQPSCVGWLPDVVDVNKLPSGRSVSVLPAPIRIEYAEQPTLSQALWEVATHEIQCNQENGRFEQVVNIESREIDFTLPVAEGCGQPEVLEPDRVYKTEPLIFALSPDEAYYAITDNTRYTSLYDAATGERIAVLKFYGEQLSFSDNSRYLITQSRSVTATWDIQALIENRLEPN